MLETINSVSQTAIIADTIKLGSVAVNDKYNRIILVDGDTIQLNQAGTYSISGLFNVSNTASAAANVTIALYANDEVIGLPVSVTIPATTGFVEVVINKVINVLPSYIGNKAKIKFITPTGVTVDGCQIDVYRLY